MWSGFDQATGTDATSITRIVLPRGVTGGTGQKYLFQRIYPAATTLHRFLREMPPPAPPWPPAAFYLPETPYRLAPALRVALRPSLRLPARLLQPGHPRDRRRLARQGWMVRWRA